jgi:hypothetical protein
MRSNTRASERAPASQPTASPIKIKMLKQPLSTGRRIGGFIDGFAARVD